MLKGKKKKFEYLNLIFVEQRYSIELEKEGESNLRAIHISCIYGANLIIVMDYVIIIIFMVV